MEIEFSKVSGKGLKRKYSELAALEVEKLSTPLKAVKRNDSYNNTPLTRTERSFAYLLLKTGESNANQISQKLKRDPRTVKKFLNNASKLESFAPNHKSKGRWPKGGGKMNTRHKNYLKKWAENGSLGSAREGWIRLRKIRNLPLISYNPVLTYLKTLGSFIRPRLKSTVSDNNKEKRLKYCQKFRRFNFKRVLFTDESLFELNRNNQKMFRLKNQPMPTRQKFNPNYRVMVWGGISYWGKTQLQFIEGTLKGKDYQKLLSSNRNNIRNLFRGKGKWYFLHDGAPCHRSEIVTNYIKRWITPHLHPHPPQSPDLNPIELIWAIMKRKVECTRPKNLRELKDSIQCAWDSINLDQIRRVIVNLPKKMDKIQACEGNLL